MSIRVLLADDHEMFLEGLRELLGKADGIELAGLARDGAEAVAAAERLQPDVVLMDMTMPRLNGIQATQKIAAGSPGTKVLVLSMHGDKNLIVESLKAGARGYVLKECSSQELCLAIQTVANGQYYLTPAILSTLIGDYLRLTESEAQSSNCPLSDRELDVLKLLVNGCNAKQIAEQLSISKNTVDTHRRHILDKLGCNSMAELTRYAIREGYLDLS
ncbi:MULTISPECIES: response regulator transcription factor [unclassified Pyramidobacter]|uniref:response regulator n=1 Tax=unclassified Pyramidobacter TaxID=2632171 RepID=UPI000EA3233A|nr:MULTISPECIES: response regulator transcription factor [unclassified Pyramidobacter]MCI7404441.1 response regulator transcription factor [Pyramidobacter sp.]MDY3213223.1 response regulator transcription factor [Pyramidobacter sp.]RKJ79493.1 DNA-binding response regulator [Pyramidobacter sp. CG50-2]